MDVLNDALYYQDEIRKLVIFCKHDDDKFLNNITEQFEILSKTPCKEGYVMLGVVKGVDPVAANAEIEVRDEAVTP